MADPELSIESLTGAVLPAFVTDIGRPAPAGCYKHSSNEGCRAAKRRGLIVTCVASAALIATVFDVNNTHLLGDAARERPQESVVDEARLRLGAALGRMSPIDQYKALYVSPDDGESLSVVVPIYTGGTRVVGAVTRGSETIGLRGSDCLAGVTDVGRSRQDADSGVLRVPLAGSETQWLVFSGHGDGAAISPADSATRETLIKYGCALTVVPDYPPAT